MRIALFLALRGMRARPRQYLMCIMGVLLGVLALTVILSVSNGFETALVESILETSGHITISSPSHIIVNWEDLCGELCRDRRILAASPCILGQCIIEKGQAFSGVNLRGILPDRENLVSGMSGKMTTGAFDFASSNEMVMGAALAGQMGVKKDDYVRLVCPDGEGYDMRVCGLYDTGVSAFDLQTIFVPLRFAQRSLGFGDGVSNVLVTTDDPLEAEQTARRIAGGTGLKATSWLSSNRTLLSALSMEKRVMFLVIVLTLVVAGFGIANVLTMAVYEKYRDIGILRAIGASRSTVMGIFVIQGFVVGLVGALSGCAGGLATGALLRVYPIALPSHIYYVDTVPVEYHAVDFLVVGLVACFVATAAGLSPARRAVAVHPWEAMRYYQ